MEKFSWEGVSNSVVEATEQPKSQPNIEEGIVNNNSDKSVEMVVEAETHNEKKFELPSSIEGEIVETDDGKIELKIDPKSLVFSRDDFHLKFPGYEVGDKFNSSLIDPKKLPYEMVNILLDNTEKN